MGVGLLLRSVRGEVCAAVASDVGLPVCGLQCVLLFVCSFWRMQNTYQSLMMLHGATVLRSWWCNAGKSKKSCSIVRDLRSFIDIFLRFNWIVSSSLSSSSSFAVLHSIVDLGSEYTLLPFTAVSGHFSPVLFYCYFQVLSIMELVFSFPCSFHCSCCGLFWHCWVLHSFIVTRPPQSDGLCTF